MKAVLLEKLKEYLLQNNPDILASFSRDAEQAEYLKEKLESLDSLPEELIAQGKPAYIVEEICMDELTKEYRPSRYNYLLSVLEGDFRSEYLQWEQNGNLTNEVINLLQSCNQVFDTLNFSEDNEDDRKIRYAIIRSIQLQLIGTAVDREYLDKINFEA